jgi:hypothetical protein
MKKFETFINDDNRDATSLDLLPKHNPVVNLGAKEYVEEMVDKNDFELLFRAARVSPKKPMEALSDQDITDKIKQRAVDYYIKNPEAIGRGLPALPPLKKSGDGISRTNNLGGSLHSSSLRVGENKLNFDDSIEKVLSYLTNSDTKPSYIVYLGELGKKFDLSNFTNIESLIEIKNQYSDAFLFDSIDEKTEQNLVEKAQSVFQGWGVRTMRNIGEVSEQSSELLQIANGRFELLTIELINNDYKLSMDVTKSVSNYIMVFISKVEIDGKHYLEFEGLMSNSTYICDIQHDYEGWKELLSNLFEKL